MQTVVSLSRLAKIAGSALKTAVEALTETRSLSRYTHPQMPNGFIYTSLVRKSPMLVNTMFETSQRHPFVRARALECVAEFGKAAIVESESAIERADRQISHRGSDVQRISGGRR